LKDIQEYVRPSSVDEAIELKSRLGNKAFFLAGGTDALVFPPPDATTAIDIMRLGLDGVGRENGTVIVGATTILRDLERHLDVTGVAGGALIEAIRETGPWLIRNAGTLVGNICNASPSADSAPMLLALDAEVRLWGGRSIQLDDFFTGPHRTVLGDELVTELRIYPRDRQGYFHKLSRSKSDIAQVNIAITARLEDGALRDVRIALGSVAPTPIRARKSEALLEGKNIGAGGEFDTLLLDELAATIRAEISPINDWRATAAYRRHSAGVMAVRGVKALVARNGSVTPVSLSNGHGR